MGNPLGGENLENFLNIDYPTKNNASNVIVSLSWYYICTTNKE